MRKKKGYAAIYTLCIILILTTLCMATLVQVVSARQATIRSERKNKVYLTAESGIEKGLTSLKQKIHATPSIFTESYVPLSTESFVFTEEYVNCNVTFQDIANYDGKGQCVKIQSQAKTTDNLVVKTLTAYILKADISNEYYDTIFNNVVTVLDDVQNNNKTSYSMADKKINMDLDGSMYLQGGKVEVKPDNFYYESGSVNVNADELLVDDSNTNLLTKMKVKTKKPVSDKVKKNVKELPPNQLSILAIKPTSPSNKELKDFYSSGRYTRINNYDVMACQQSSKDASGNTITTLVTFKITKKAGAQANSVFPWSTFVQDVKDYIMRNMIKINGSSFTGNPSGSNYGDAFEKAYKGMYKLYIIEGDVSVQTPGNVSGYINHIIYCTNKMQFKKGTNPYVFIENTSVMCKQMTVEDMDDNYDSYGQLVNRGMELHGVKKLDEVVGAGELSPFSAGNRANINKFLMEHLDGYADALRFKVYKWEEN